MTILQKKTHKPVIILDGDSSIFVTMGRQFSVRLRPGVP
jgi:hypothetical protein